MEERTLDEDEMELYGLKLMTDPLENEEDWEEEETEGGRIVLPVRKK